MTLRFILDENVIILAHKQQDDRGVPDRTCRDLLERIIDICYPLVLSPWLQDKYWEQLGNQPAVAPDVPHVLAILASAWRRAGKVDNQPNAPSFPEETNIPQGSRDDVGIVRLAVASGAILVTTDQPLLTDLETSGISQTYRLQVVSPDDALNLL